MSLTDVTYSRDSLPVLNLNAPDIWQDIHAPLREAREMSPFGVSGEGAIHVLRDAEVEACLRDPRFLAADLMALNGLRSGPLWEWWNSVMFSKNPPEHTRLRKLVSRAFTPRSVERLRPQIAGHVQSILAPALEVGRFDAQGDLGHRLPLAVISDLLDIPEADRASFGVWTKQLGLAFSAIRDPLIHREIEDALAQLDAYVKGLIAERRKAPGEDLLSALIQVEEAGDRLTTDEMVALTENLMFAGHDTTRGALAAMAVLFARNPDQLAAVAADPELVPRAAEEVLRYEPITFGTARLASETMDFAGLQIGEGEPVVLCLTAACRDPRRYADPDRFDVQRQDVKSTTFGAGIHFCLGATLARVELEEAIRVLAQPGATLELTDEPRWVPLAQIRCYEPPVWVSAG
ncbi:MAG TPA: cytochrome P450 [Frankiaceae bacterium]|nr:cytochrome P450 [Frankiaceae bacterium]